MSQISWLDLGIPRHHETRQTLVERGYHQFPAVAEEGEVNKVLLFSRLLCLRLPPLPTFLRLPPQAFVHKRYAQTLLSVPYLCRRFRPLPPSELRRQWAVWIRFKWERRDRLVAAAIEGVSVM